MFGHYFVWKAELLCLFDELRILEIYIDDPNAWHKWSIEIQMLITLTFPSSLSSLWCSSGLFVRPSAICHSQSSWKGELTDEVGGWAKSEQEPTFASISLVLGQFSSWVSQSVLVCLGGWSHLVAEEDLGICTGVESFNLKLLLQSYKNSVNIAAMIGF